MSRFIKVSSHPEKLPVFIRWDLVEAISSDTEGTTYVQLSPESASGYALVSETPEEVASMVEIENAAEWGAPTPWLNPKTDASEVKANPDE